MLQSKEAGLVILVTNAALRLVPPDWEIHVCENCWQEPNCGAWVAGFRMSLLERGMWVPTPVTATCLAYFLHEVGHVVLKQPLTRIVGTVETERLEREASEWAKEFMESYSLPVPPRAWEFMRFAWESSGPNLPDWAPEGTPADVLAELARRRET